MPSVLGTIVVENFFSTVRAKCRYPNLWEYAVYCRRAYFELIKVITYSLGPKWARTSGKSTIIKLESPFP